MLDSRSSRSAAIGLALASSALIVSFGCTDSTPGAAETTSTPVVAPKSAPKVAAKVPVAPVAVRPGSLPPRVQTLATNGSEQMKTLILRAKGQSGVEAANTWVEAGDLAKKALEVTSALDLYQLGQRAAPKACAPFKQARLLVTEIGKIDVALMLLNTELECDGAKKTVLRKEGERLQKLLVDGIHAHGGGKKAPPKTPAAP